MVELTIVPIEHHAEGLERVADRLAEAFEGKFDGVRLASPVSKYDLPHQVLYREPAWHTAYKEPLMDFLDKLHPAVLGVTGLQVIDPGPLVPVLKGDRLRSSGVTSYHQYVHRFFGASDRSLHAAFVSTFYPSMGIDGSQRRLDRITAVGFHELSHLFGLSHHEHRAAGEGLCSMSMLDNYRRFGRSRLISGWSTALCDDCYGVMARPA